MNRFVRLPLVPGVKAVTLSVGMGLPPFQHILGLQWLPWGHHLEAATVCRRCGQSLDLQAKCPCKFTPGSWPCWERAGGCKKKWWQPEKLTLQCHIPAWMLKTLSNLYPELDSQVDKKDKG
jgi:hypothetical protein